MVIIIINNLVTCNIEYRIYHHLTFIVFGTLHRNQSTETRPETQRLTITFHLKNNVRIWEPPRQIPFIQLV